MHRLSRSTRRLALALTLPLLAACGSDTDAPSAPSPAATLETTTFAPSLGVDLAASTRLVSGLYIRDLPPPSPFPAGPPVVVVPGQTLTVRYTGWLANGTRFDGNMTSGDPFVFVLGAGRVIPGWDQGLVGTRVGGLRQLVIPSALGYGPTGSGPIPPNAVLVFNVQVLSAR